MVSFPSSPSPYPVPSLFVPVFPALDFRVRAHILLQWYVSKLSPAHGLAARQIEVRYGPDSPPVLADFTLSLRAGDFVGVIGPNGSGKSTLVRALSRALQPAGGVVLLDGRDLYRDLGARDLARTVGVVPQETAISLDFTVREVVRMGRAPHLPRRPFAAETAQDESIVTQSLEQAGVGTLAERAVTTLSGGERQRVLVARALAQQPAVLLLDEPTAHLDLRHQSEILTLARDLARDQGKAVLAVLHDLNLAAAYCDRLILLHGGRIAAEGPPDQVLTAGSLQTVYGARAWVRRHPATGRPLVLTLPPGPDDAAPNGPAVHVICGGGTGTALLLALHRQGHAVTAGGLNDGDTDAEAADLLGVPYAHAAPFSTLSEAAQVEAARLAAPARAVVLSEVPFGRANLSNLEAALALLRAGKPVICLQRPGSDFADRDFTGGEAAALWEQLKSEGAVTVPDEAAALAFLESVTDGIRP